MEDTIRRKGMESNPFSLFVFDSAQGAVSRTAHMKYYSVLHTTRPRVIWETERIGTGRTKRPQHMHGGELVYRTTAPDSP
jgi:hypothetical protein